MLTATRYHDISVGHRVFNHASKCKHLHGHNYRIHFTLKAFDSNSNMVLDFGIIKKLFCTWLEENWDHHFLLWENDTWIRALQSLDPGGLRIVPFNPTAENMAKYLLTTIAPELLKEYSRVHMKRIVVEETRKCSAAFEV